MTNKTLIIKCIIGMLITAPLGYFIQIKFGTIANLIYWGSIILGQIMQQLLWNYY